MTPALRQLPDLLRTAFKAGGLDAVRKLAKAFGGRVIYIPSRRALTDRHLLVQVAGRAVAEALCDGPGRHVEFPRAEAELRKLMVAAMAMPSVERPNGHSHNQIAEVLRCTRRRVKQIRHELKGGGALASTLAGTPVPIKQDARQIDLEQWLRTTLTPSRK